MNDPVADVRVRKRRADVYVGASLLAMCGLVFWNTTTFQEVPAMLSQNVPPTFFPRLVLTAIAVLSVALVVAGANRTHEPDERVSPRIYVTAAAITLIVALVPRLGTLSSVCLAGLVLPLCWRERRLSRIALLAGGLPLTIYLIFVLALGMRLPTGLLP